MDALRRRNPFKSNDEGEEPSHVLDDQEQEELISTLRDSANQANKNYHVIFVIITTMSFLMYLVFFVTQSAFDESLIILARPLTFLQILVHINLLLLLTAETDTALHRLAKDRPSLFPRVTWLLGFSCLAPVISIVQGKSWQQTGWWSMTLLVALSVRSLLAWSTEEEESIAQLEKLKYSAGGA